MSVRTPGLSVEIAVASMDLYPWDVPGHPSWNSNIEQLVPYLAETGCCNFEIHPTDTIVQDVAARKRRGETELVNAVIGSLHQTFQSDGILCRVADWRGVTRSPASILSMTAIQSALSCSVPGVYYANDASMLGRVASEMSYDTNSHLLEPNSPRILSVVQPSAEAYRDCGTHDDATLLQRVSEAGILGFCPDTVHARRKAKDGTKPPPVADVWAEQFASGHVYQMHTGADRVDIAKRDPELAAISVQEFQAFMSRRWQDGRNTELGDMIVAAIENWTPPAELAQAVGGPVLRNIIEIPPRPRAVFRRVAEHARFVENLAEIVREAGAMPLLWNAA